VSTARRVFAFASAAMLAACGIDTFGLEDAFTDGGPDAGSDVSAFGDSSYGGDTSLFGSDSGHPEGSGSSSSGGDATTGDGPAESAADVVVVDVVPMDGCKPKGPENCTNGMDDDCNGLADCADPACTSVGYGCVPPAPGGWNFVAQANQVTGCPGNLKETQVTIDPTGLSTPATCGCQCFAGVQPSCTHGNVVSTFGPDSTCSSTAPNLPGNDGNCNAANLTVAAFVKATAPAASGGTCVAAPTMTIPPVGGVSGSYCSGENMFGGGCSGGQVCALVPSPQFHACVRHGGSLASCPAGGYGVLHSVGMITDTRGCGTCTCSGTPTATCNGKWDFWDNNNCSGADNLEINVDGQCDVIDGPHARLQQQQADHHAHECDLRAALAAAAHGQRPAPERRDALLRELTTRRGRARTARARR